MRELYDYIIAGGGIAGCVFAKIMSECGFRCLILEKEAAPFEKVCGGWVPHSAVQQLIRLGFDADSLLKNGAVLTKGAVISKNGREQTYAYAEGEYGIGTSRLALHRLLTDTAARAGCEIRFSEYVRAAKRDGGIYTINGFRAKAWVSAIGANVGLCRDRSGLYRGQSFGISELVEAKSKLRADMVHFFYPNDTTDYFWEIPVGDNLWNIGLWSASAEGLKRKFFQARAEYACAHFLRFSTVRAPKGGVCGSSDYRCRVSAEPVYGIGDFAGCNNPQNGAGIGAAIESAQELAFELKERGAAEIG